MATQETLNLRRDISNITAKEGLQNYLSVLLEFMAFCCSNLEMNLHSSPKALRVLQAIRPDHPCEMQVNSYGQYLFTFYNVDAADPVHYTFKLDTDFNEEEGLWILELTHEF